VSRKKGVITRYSIGSLLFGVAKRPLDPMRTRRQCKQDLLPSLHMLVAQENGCSF
jgi:hypothetical protein